MSTVQEIESAIDTLSQDERDELWARLDLRYPHAIEAQLEADLAAGLFDDRIRRAAEERASGKLQPLPGA